MSYSSLKRARATRIAARRSKFPPKKKQEKTQEERKLAPVTLSRITFSFFSFFVFVFFFLFFIFFFIIFVFFCFFLLSISSCTFTFQFTHSHPYPLISSCENQIRLYAAILMIITWHDLHMHVQARRPSFSFFYLYIILCAAASSYIGT